MQPDRKPARDIGLDITRIVAFVSVPCVHFFKDTQFYSTPVLGVRMYIMCVMRTMFMVCVPLFILLSGYLMSNRDIPLSRKGIAAHIAKTAKLFATYALATVVILAYRRWGMKEDITLLKGLLNILDFQQYSWYVNMYLGLYLMMPFLNALWRALEGREAQRTLLGALLLLTVLPSVLNIYDFVTEGALLRPWLTQTRYGLVPDWWRNIYPITYYYIGAYVRRNVAVKRLNTWKLLAFFCTSVVFFGLFNIWRSYSIKFAEGPWEDWGGLQNTANAVLLFLLINSIDYPTPNQAVSRAVGLVSNLTFGAYLVSWVADRYFYARLRKAEPVMQLRLNHYPVVVGKVILCSLAMSLVIYLVVEGIWRLFAKLRQRRNA